MRLSTYKAGAYSRIARPCTDGSAQLMQQPNGTLRILLVPEARNVYVCIGCSRYRRGRRRDEMLISKGEEGMKAGQVSKAQHEHIGLQLVDRHQHVGLQERETAPRNHVRRDRVHNLFVLLMCSAVQALRLCHLYSLQSFLGCYMAIRLRQSRSIWPTNDMPSDYAQN